MNKKVLTIFMLGFLIVISLGTISMIEFYYAKDNDRMPTLAIKSENVSKQYEKYSSIIYDAYKCYSGTVFVLGKNDDEPICNRVIRFDQKGYYTNINGFRIIKKDYQMIYDISKTLNEIETFRTKKELENAKKVAEEYQRSLHIPLRTTIVNKEIVNIESYKELVISNDYGDYSWQYQRGNEKYYVCVKDGMIKEYKDGNCLGEWGKIKLSTNWCSLAQNNSIPSIKKAYNENCK